MFQIIRPVCYIMMYEKPGFLISLLPLQRNKIRETVISYQMIGKSKKYIKGWSSLDHSIRDINDFTMMM